METNECHSNLIFYIAYNTFYDFFVSKLVCTMNVVTTESKPVVYSRAFCQKGPFDRIPSIMIIIFHLLDKYDGNYRQDQPKHGQSDTDDRHNSRTLSSNTKELHHETMRLWNREHTSISISMTYKFDQWCLFCSMCHTICINSLYHAP